MNGGGVKGNGTSLVPCRPRLVEGAYVLHGQSDVPARAEGHVEDGEVIVVRDVPVHASVLDNDLQDLLVTAVGTEVSSSGAAVRQAIDCLRITRSTNEPGDFVKVFRSVLRLREVAEAVERRPTRRLAAHVSDRVGKGRAFRQKGSHNIDVLWAWVLVGEEVRRCLPVPVTDHEVLPGELLPVEMEISILPES